MDIAEAFDAVGGEANAATGKEHTCYYARVLDTDLPMAVDVIADMVTSARLDTDELETERGVILEELAMNDDDPSDVVHEQFAAAVLGAHALGRPIGGTPDTIRAVPRDAVWEHYREHYRPSTLVVTAAGGVDHDVLCAQVTEALTTGGWPLDAGAEPRSRRVPTDVAVQAGQGGIPAAGVELTIRRHTEQANVIIGGTSLTATDPKRFTLSVLNAVLGGGMSSRLFQEIRERRGLAYSTYSFASGHADTGVFGLYAGCTPGKVDEVVALMVAEWERMADAPITQAELERSMGQLAGGLVLGMEDSGSRMSRLGKSELVHGVAAEHRRVARPDPRRHRAGRAGPGRRPGVASALGRARRPLRGLTRRTPGRSVRPASSRVSAAAVGPTSPATAIANAPSAAVASSSRRRLCTSRPRVVPSTDSPTATATRVPPGPRPTSRAAATAATSSAAARVDEPRSRPRCDSGRPSSVAIVRIQAQSDDARRGQSHDEGGEAPRPGGPPWARHRRAGLTGGDHARRRDGREQDDRLRTPGATTTASIAGRARSGIVRVGLTGPGHHGNHQPEPSPNAERAPSAVQATTTETATVVVSPRRVAGWRRPRPSRPRTRSSPTAPTAPSCRGAPPASAEATSRRRPPDPARRSTGAGRGRWRGLPQPTIPSVRTAT